MTFRFSRQLPLPFAARYSTASTGRNYELSTSNARKSDLNSVSTLFVSPPLVLSSNECYFSTTTCNYIRKTASKYVFYGAKSEDEELFFLFPY